MLYGLTGSSGTGKTTLCKVVSDQLDIPFMPTSITECARRHGFEAVGALSIRERLKLQNHLLEDHIEAITKAARPLIVDRTPIDMIGYLMCEFDMHSHLRSTKDEIAEAETYVQRALKATKDYYDYVFLIGQLDFYQAAETRPSDNRAYQTHSQLVMEGAMARLTNKVNYSILRETDLDLRTEWIVDIITKRLDKIEKEKRSSAHLH